VTRQISENFVFRSILVAKNAGGYVILVSKNESIVRAGRRVALAVSRLGSNDAEDTKKSGMNTDRK
jgi:hypothetical protein